jgi:hypothetical protein
VPESGSKSRATCAYSTSSDGGRTRVDKVSAELVTLTYGTIVAQLCKDYEYNYPEVNKQLEKMGYNIGIRLIEDFLAKSSAPTCTNFREVAEMISKVAQPTCTESTSGSHVRLGRLQDLPEHHAHHHQLVQRQQAVLPHLRREPPCRLCRAARRRSCAGRAVVLEYTRRCATWSTGDGRWTRPWQLGSVH